MKKFTHSIDLLAESLLCGFASHIVYRVATLIKVDPDELSLLVKGLVHNHWYVTDEFVKGCQYCERIKQFNRSTADGVPAIPIKIATIKNG